MRENKSMYRNFESLRGEVATRHREMLTELRDHLESKNWKRRNGKKVKCTQTPALLRPEFSGSSNLSQALFLTSIPLHQALHSHIWPLKPHGNFRPSQPVSEFVSCS